MVQVKNSSITHCPLSDNDLIIVIGLWLTRVARNHKSTIAVTYSWLGNSRNVLKALIYYYAVHSSSKQPICPHPKADIYIYYVKTPHFVNPVSHWILVS